MKKTDEQKLVEVRKTIGPVLKKYGHMDGFLQGVLDDEGPFLRAARDCWVACCEALRIAESGTVAGRKVGEGVRR